MRTSMGTMAFSSTPISLRSARISVMSSWTQCIWGSACRSQGARLRIHGQSDRSRRRIAVVERVPDFFREEGHEGREQAERGLEDTDECGEGGLGLGFVRGFREVEAQLDDLEVPIAEAAPEELIDRVGRFVEPIVFELFADESQQLNAARRRSSGLRADRSGLAVGMEPKAAGSTVMPSSAARSTFMKRKRAAFQILLAKAR